MEHNLREYMASEWFTEIIGNLQAKGLEAPLYFSAIAANGSIDMGSFERVGETADLKPTFLTQHSAGGFHGLPIHILVVHSRGAAARVVIEGSGEPQIINS